MRTQHTSEFDDVALKVIRAFLDEAFDGGFDDHDWDHALGGIHAVAWDGGSVIAHGSVVQRRFLHRGRPLRVGYVEAVAVRADRRRAGYGAAIMQRLNHVVRSAYQLGALSAGPDAARLYRSLGWQHWEGTTWVLGPKGIERTADEDETTHVLVGDDPVDLAADLVCDWRSGDIW